MTTSYISVFVINLRTKTFFFCPILCALSCACKSICGFQSESNRITVSAVCKFNPRPPALVLNKNTSYGESYILNN